MWRYRLFFWSRFIVEFVKVAIVVCIPVFQRILWIPLEKFDENINQNQYLSFLILGSMSLLFTLTTTLWLLVKIKKAQKMRK